MIDLKLDPAIAAWRELNSRKPYNAETVWNSARRDWYNLKRARKDYRRGGWRSEGVSFRTYLRRCVFENPAIANAALRLAHSNGRRC